MNRSKWWVVLVVSASYLLGCAEETEPSSPIDGDDDGAAFEADCDDDDPTIGARADDADCDGVLTAEDCDDDDASVLGMNDDSDCDGVLTATDCDDADPAITFECIVVSSGGIHSCAVLRSGEVACWGIENVPADNDYYEQGQAT